MKPNHWIATLALSVLGLLALFLFLAGDRPAQPHATGLAPTLSLDQTSAEEFPITDFDALHSPVKGDANRYLILGNLALTRPVADLPSGLAALLGRWEGYSYAPPVKKDQKVVLVIQQIGALDGTAVGWGGTNLQFPDIIGKLHFRVIQGGSPAIEFQTLLPGGIREIVTFSYRPEKDQLEGWLKFLPDNTTSGPYVLTRDRTFDIYKDYTGYLAGKRIYPVTYQKSALQHFGKGYLVYLPEGYEDQPAKNWPLIIFLHGYGDRGDNLLLLPKASPFMYIREQGPLPFIIVAPLLSSYEGYSSFPEEYMDGVLAEARAVYRVDPTRVYVTGLSMGGEATYRFALHQPGTFAAAAPLSAYLDHPDVAAMRSIKDLPIWAIHGAQDTVIPLERARQPVEALEQAGNSIRFSVLPGHDHDVWTDTYSDPAFYAWLLAQARD